MADITVTAAQVAAVNENEYEGETYLIDAGVTITPGQAISINPTTGRARLANAGAAPTANVRGIAHVVANGVVQAIKHGSVYGFNLAGRAYDDPIYLSNTAGALADAAGTTSVVIGRVKPMHDGGGTPVKVLYVNIPAIM